MPNTTYGSPYAQSSDLVSNWPGVSLNVADRIDDVSFKGNGLNDQTGTTYTLVLTDAGKTVTLNNASAVTVTIPTNASVAYETGTVIEFTNKGAGIVTISPAGGVTLNNSSTLAQYASCYIQKLETNAWVMVNAPAAGLTLITSSTFTSVSSVSVNNCFTSTYDNYRIMLLTTINGADDVYMRLRASGTDTSTNYNRQSLLGEASSAAAARATAQTSIYVMRTSNATFRQSAVMDLFGPQIAGVTTYNLTFANHQSATTPYLGVSVGNQSDSTQFDGFTLLSANNITGTVRVYGYRNS